ncbi:MAG: YdcF family protein [Candidatus Tectomicrobia bacterium]|nr:YdcF family protein [Candidatus Tectomicrobia bacterium]
MKNRWFVFLVILLVVWAIVRHYEQILTLVAEFLIVEDKPEQADLIVVLPGRAFEKAQHAANLYKAGYAKKILALGAQVPEAIQSLGMNLTEAEILAKALVAQGVPSRDIIVMKEKGTNRFEEAQVASEFIAKGKYRSMILVSSIYHMRRISLTFASLFKDSDVKLIRSPSRYGELKSEQWWIRESDVIFISSEYVKLGSYLWNYLRHGHNSLPYL